MHRPDSLKNEAKEFWDTHAKELKKRRILTENSFNSFVILCQTWGMLQVVIRKLDEMPEDRENYREMAQRHALTKDYMQFARQFGLLPADAKRTKMDEETEAETDEFGI